ELPAVPGPLHVQRLLPRRPQRRLRQRRREVRPRPEHPAGEHQQRQHPDHPDSRRVRPRDTGPRIGASPAQPAALDPGHQLPGFAARLAAGWWSLMLLRATKVRLFLFSLIAVVGIVYVGGTYAGLDRLFFSRGYRVTVQLADS